MNIVTLDFETYFDSEYSLKRLTVEEYVRDPRFEPLGLGVRFINGDLRYFPDPEEFLCNSREDKNLVVLCHHAHFDCLVLSHHFNIRPRFILDTLSMARMVLGSHASLSLDSLAKTFGLPLKTVPYNLFRGKHWADLSAEEQRLVAEGCLHDVDLTWTIFQRLAADFPPSELPIVDATIRMFTEPSLEGDIELLGKVWTDEERRKANLLGELGVDAASLQSAEQFAGLLRRAGVEPDTKPSPTDPERRTFAFAKTDDFMRTLSEEDSDAGDLVRARLGIKSSIMQTRAARLGWMARRGPLCIALTAYAAHTLRWGGAEKTNFQNFPRKGDIRKAIRAPKGYLLAKADASQIEARLLNTLAGQWDVVEKFRAGDDIYVERATQFYGRQITKADKPERGLGKQIELSCGYGSGAETIVATAKKGSYGPPVMLTPEDGLRARDLYRATHGAVVAYWATAGRMLARIAGGPATDWGPMQIKDRRVYLPNGTWLNFESLEYDRESQNWRYQTRHGWQKIWGSSLVAETTQALARVLTARVISRARSEGLKVVWTTHDDVVLLVKDDGHAEETLRWLEGEMTWVPPWLPDLPLACEGTLSERYGE